MSELKAKKVTNAALRTIRARTRIRNGTTQDSHEFGKIFVIYGMRWRQSIGSLIGGADAGNRNGVRAGLVRFVEVLRVLQHGQNFESVIVQAKQGTNTHVVDSCDLRAIHGLQAIFVVALGAAGVESFECLWMVRFLEQGVCAHCANENQMDFR